MPQVMLHVKEASHLVGGEMAPDVGIAGESLGEVAVGECVGVFVGLAVGETYLLTQPMNLVDAWDTYRAGNLMAP